MKDDFKKFATKSRGISSLGLHDYQAITNKMLLPMAMTPNIIEERQMNAVLLSVFDRLMMDRIIFLGMPIDAMVANVVNAQLLFLESVDSEKEIFIYFNSPGGEIYSGLGIYDLMQYIKPKVSTVCTGMAASMAAVLLCAGAKGRRSALSHSRIMIHQPMGNIGGQASDIEIAASEIKKMKKELYDIISKHSGKPYKVVEKDSDRDFWMSAEEAKTYGLIDKVL